MAKQKSNKGTAEQIKAMSNIVIVVLGDLVLDEYIYGTTARVSREAPVLIVDVEDEQIGLGGAANTAANAAALGATVKVCGLVGNDLAGKKLKQILKKQKIDVSGLVTATDYTTPTKSRVLAGDFHTRPQQIVRLDRRHRTQISNAMKNALSKAFAKVVKGADVVLLSDYGQGMFMDTVWACDMVKKYTSSIMTIADSRYNLTAFASVIDGATPNEPEVEAALGVTLDSDDDVATAGKKLRGQLGCEALVITRGNRGMALFEKGKAPHFVPVIGSPTAIDVSGAGDSVIATYALALAAGATQREAVDLANHAGSCAVMTTGARPVSASELIAACAGNL